MGIWNKRNTKLINDLSEKHFGSWKVICLGSKNGRRTMWKCECSCGKIIEVDGYNLKSGRSTNCGCKRPKKSDRINWKGYGTISGKYWNGIKGSAKKRRIDFNINIKFAWNLYILQNNRCALSDIDISFINNTASLDRIDSKKGYTKDNVQWVHKDVNIMKNVFDQEYFVKMCKRIAELSQ